MRLVIQGSFDPITQKELEWIRKEQKKQGIRDVWLYVKEQGVLEKHLRQRWYSVQQHHTGICM